MTKYFDPRTFILLFCITLAVDYMKDSAFEASDVGHTVIAAILGTLLYTNFIKKYVRKN